MIQIEKNVPIPAMSAGRTSGGLGEVSAVAMCMAVGDSFFLKESQRAALGRVQFVSKKHGIKFTSRREGDGTRLWRVA